MMEGLLDLWGLPPFFVGLITSTISTAIGIWIGYDAGKRQGRFDYYQKYFLAERQAKYLWEVLDDIDTASDRFMDDYEGLAEYVHKRDKDRHKVAISDGYSLTFTGWDPDPWLHERKKSDA